MKKTAAMFALCGAVFALACGSDSTLTPSKDISTTDTQKKADSTTTTTPAPQNGVATFDLTVQVVGVLAGGDTTRTQPASGVALTVTRISDAQGHAITPASAGTATTDATGSASIKGIAGGNFTIAASPAAGSALRSATVSIAAPLTSQANVYLVLLRNP